MEIVGVLEKVSGFFSKKKEQRIAEKKAQPLEVIAERWKESEDPLIQSFGGTLREETQLMLQRFIKTREASPRLSPDKFLENERGRLVGSRWIKGHGWNVGDLSRNTPEAGKGGGFRIDRIGRFVGSDFYDIKWRRFEGDTSFNNDQGFAFAIKSPFGGIGNGHTRTEGRFTELVDEGGERTGLRFWIREEMGGQTGEFYAHKGAVLGIALEIPDEVDIKYLQDKVGELGK